jgi:uncharacterized SAM-binding protein YcdF (DUF218 family)
MIFGPWKLIAKIISGFFSIVFLYFAFTFVQIWMTSHDHSTQNADAILVFGTAEDNGTPSPALQARLNEALVVWNEHRANWIAVTGGNKPGDVYTEAEVSASYLEAHGVPASKILKGAGSDTWQNVATVLPLLEEHNIHSVITVTDPFHEFRAMAISSAQGLDPFPSPVPNSPTIKSSLWLYYAKETFDVGIGRIVGYGTLSSWTTTATTANSIVHSVTN